MTTDYDPILHTTEEGMEYARQNPEVFEQRFAQERAVVEDIDPNRDRGAHEHQQHRTREIGKGARGKQEICVCGARRDISLIASSPWIGGQIPQTPWEMAHLEAVRRAVENTPELMDLQPDAIQNINTALANDPPSGTQDRDQTALAQIYGIARGAAHRLMYHHRNNPDPLG